MEVIRFSHLPDECAAQVEEIYEASFPACQRSEFSQLVGSIAKGERALFVASDRGRVLGFALTLPLACEGVFYLEYLAVTMEARGSGVGGSLLRHVADTLRLSEGAQGVLFEVEPPDGVESDLSRRRVRFYLRNGASLIHQVTSLRMPDLTGPGSVPMRLMWLPLIPGQPLGNSSLRKCITSIYCDAYGLEEDHPLLQSALKDLDSVESLA